MFLFFSHNIFFYIFVFLLSMLVVCCMQVDHRPHFKLTNNWEQTPHTPTNSIQIINLYVILLLLLKALRVFIYLFCFSMSIAKSCDAIFMWMWRISAIVHQCVEGQNNLCSTPQIVSNSLEYLFIFFLPCSITIIATLFFFPLYFPFCHSSLFCRKK